MVATLNFFHQLLARCDTIHDFTRARAASVMRPPFSTSSIYSQLDKIPTLNKDRLTTNFKLQKPDKATLRDFACILQRTTSPQFTFLKAYDLGGDSRRVGYEPAVVQFFEHSLGRLGLLDEFYLTTLQTIFQDCSIDYTVSDLPAESPLPPGKVCVMNLGNIGEEASGVFASQSVAESMQRDLHRFFSPDSDVQFRVDASCVRHDLFHNPKLGIQVVHSVASEWDAAPKFSAGEVLGAPPVNLKRKNSYGILHVVQSLRVSPPTCEINGARMDIKDLPREVGNIIACAQADVDPRYRATIATLDTTFDPQDPADRLQWLFDVKRSGDGAQVLHIKDHEEGGVFVTNDHLAFLKARMCGVPAVFTKRNGRTGSLMLVCINSRYRDQAAFKASLLKAVEKEKGVVWQDEAKIRSAFKSVIHAFEGVKDSITTRFFSRSFSRAVYAGLTAGVKDGGPSFDALTARQLQDLEVIKNRLQLYVFDFLATYIDLNARLAMLPEMVHVFHKLQAQDTPSDLDGLIKFSHELATLKSKGYGPEQYTWCLNDGSVADVVDKLSFIKAKIESTDPIDVLNAHFFLEDSPIAQLALNFKPLHIYNDIWAFAKHGFVRVSLGQHAQPRVSFDNVWRTFAASREKALASAARVNDARAMSIVREQLDEAYALDSLYKEMILEDSEQNFSFRLPLPMEGPVAGGGGGDASPSTVEMSDVKDVLYFEAVRDSKVNPPLATLDAYLEIEQAALRQLYPNAELQYGGGRTRQLVQAVASENVELVLQVVIILLSFVFLNGVLVKNSNPEKPRNLAANILANSGLTCALLLVDLQDTVKLYVFALYLAAVGYMISKFM